MENSKNRAAQVFSVVMCVLSLFWIAASAYYAIRHGFTQVFHGVTTALMAANGIAFSALAFLARKGKPLVSIISFLFLVANFILTVTDQVGAVDIAVLALDAAAIICLIVARRKPRHSACIGN